MKEQIRILLLEDLESDAQLAELEIKKTFHNYRFEWTDTKNGFIKLLKEFDPDIIISDYRLPMFDGLSALRIKQELKPNIPFIVFTGSQNEDTAVDCMKAGATDYIIKEHIKRLGPAMLNALEQKNIIESKHKAEKELIQNEEKFRRLAENIPDVLFRYQLIPSQKIEYVNHAITSLTGYSPHDFYTDSKLLSKIIHEDDRHIIDGINNEGFEFFKSITIRWVKKDKTIIWLEQRLIPIFDIERRLIAVEGIVRDITEKRNDETLKQAIFSIAQAANTTKSLDELFEEVHKTISYILPANNFYIALYHDDTDEVSFPYFIDEKDSRPLRRKSRKGFTEYVISTGQSLLCNQSCAKQLQESGLVEVYGSPHKVWVGTPLIFENKTIGAMVVQHYSDENVYAEKEKKMLEYVSTQIAKAIVYKQALDQILKLSKAIEQSPISLVVTNTHGEIEYVNSAFTELTGYKAEEVLGRNPSILKSGKTPAETIKDLWETILSGKVWKGEFINRKKNGEIFIESANISPLIDENGKIINFLALKEDITEKKHIEQQLIEAKEKAEISDKLKTAFLQNISHEIRTPMNAIIGFAELMDINFNDTKKLHEYIDFIKQRSDDLLGIINELLDISRIETGLQNFKYEQVDLNSLFDEIFLMFNEQNVKYRKTNIELKYIKISKRITPLVSTDPVKLKQIFINLVHNAYKFTEKGEIKFGFHSLEDDYITFFVSDTGIGVSGNMKDLIFERFRKLSDESGYAPDGLGLGLAIVKGLLKLFNGKIWVESQPNIGSTFYFSIPFLPLKEVLIDDKAKLKLKLNKSNITIQIVEDDNFNAAVFSAYLHDAGIKLLICKTGAHAITTFTNNLKIDLVLMDIKLPDVSGYEVTKRMKKIRPEIPIIAQTAYAAEADRKRAFEAGCDDFMAKPIKKEKLFEMINKYLKK